MENEYCLCWRLLPKQESQTGNYAGEISSQVLFSRTKVLNLINNIDCESHREQFLEYLKSKF